MLSGTWRPFWLGLNVLKLLYGNRLHTLHKQYGTKLCNMSLLQVNISQLDLELMFSDNMTLTLFFSDKYRHINLEPLQICPAFADFEFLNWNRDGEVGDKQAQLVGSWKIILYNISIHINFGK